MRNRSIVPFLIPSSAIALFLLAPVLTSAQTAGVQPRITAAVDETKLVALRGNTHPLARPEFDRGTAPSSLPMQRMLLVLKRSPEQETALDALLDQQLDTSSPSYHQWLTPQQFGQQFGPADQDIQTVTSWLQSHGFAVNRVSNGRTVIEFSGSVSEVTEAFHTEIHKYTVNGEDHWANASDPQVPVALTPVIVGIDTLYNFPRRQMHEIVGVFSREAATGVVKRSGPQFTFPDPCSATAQPFCNFAVGPADFAKIYDVPNLLLSPAPATQFNGDGVTIAIVAESDIDTKDVSDFRSLFGLPAPKLNVIVDGPDPGVVFGAETEADLDVQWSGAVAPNATIDLIVSGTTEVSLGADLSAQYAVDNNVAPILNESFGLCEFFIGTSGNTFYNQLWQQAAAQGITVTVSSGDSGSAGCDRGIGAALGGLAVSGFTSTPYNVSVGGTDFNDINSFSTFWNLNSGDTPTTASAKGYIPEMTWNDTCTNQEIFSFFSTTTAEQTCNNFNAQADGLVGVAGGSGGQSNCTTSDGQNETSCGGGYPKPSFQTALTPNDGKRDIPDVSLFASNGFNGSFYLICESDANPGATSCDPYAAASDFLGIGGTSASSPAFAGIMALVNQATGSRQGNANYILYKLAAQSGASCPSTASPKSSCVFYDVPSGSTIAMPCAPNSPNCVVSTAGDQIGVLSGFATTSGYDLATGLGSVNAKNLINVWKTAETGTKPTTTALTLNSGSAVKITHGQPANVSISVTAASGTPTGAVSLIANTAPPTAPTEVTQQGVQSFTLPIGSSSVSATTTVLPGSPGGQPYTVFARYSGDGVFHPSDSSPVSVTVNPEASTSQIILELFDPTTGFQTNPNATATQYGSSLELLRMNVTSQSGDTCAQNAPGQLGCPTGSVTITNNGSALDAGTYPLNIDGYAEDQNFQLQLPGGANTLKLTYGGDNSFLASNSTSVITIAKAPTTTTMNVPSNVILGGFNTLTANITSVGVGAGPTGQVTFFDGATQLGNPVAITNSVAGSPTNKPQAQVTLTTSQLPLGNNSITAQYTGDGNYTASTSAPAVMDVQILTGLSLSSSSQTINHGSSVTFTAVVNPTQTGGPPPTGTIVFTANGINIGTMPVTNNQAQVTTSALPGGTVNIDANYSGDANYTISAAGIGIVVNLLATTTTITTSNANIQQGASVTLTSTVAPVQSGGPALTGTVQFFSAVSPQGSDNPIGGPVSLVNGQAQVTTTSLPTNIQLVGAAYSGDNNYANSGASIPETVTGSPSFTVSASPATVIIGAPGQSGSTTLTFVSQNGLSGSGSLSSTTCGTSPSEEITCTLGAFTLPANGTAQAMLTFVTMKASANAPLGRNHPPSFDWRTTAAAIAFGCFLLIGALAVGYRGKQRRLILALNLAAFVLLVMNAGCGGGGGGGGGGGNPGTPVGTVAVNVTITINGQAQTVPNLTVNVQ